MRAFVIWSGKQSRGVARELRELIEKVHKVKCFFSEDIEPGAQWRNIIGKNLEEANFAIVCLTRESLGSRWLHFEAGAVAKLAGEASVVPYLVGSIDQGDVEGPLSGYHGVRADRDGTLKILRKMNEARPRRMRIKKEELSRAFDDHFGNLEAVLREESPDLAPSILDRIAKLEQEVNALRSQKTP